MSFEKSCCWLEVTERAVVLEEEGIVFETTPLEEEPEEVLKYAVEGNDIALDVVEVVEFDLSRSDAEVRAHFTVFLGLCFPQGVEVDVWPSIRCDFAIGVSECPRPCPPVRSEAPSLS